MSKTPEEMAEDYRKVWGDEQLYKIRHEHKRFDWDDALIDGFLAGYKAAQDQVAEPDNVTEPPAIEAVKKPVVPEPHSIFKVDWKKASEESPKENIYDSCGLLIVVESMTGQRWLDCSRWRNDRGFIDMDYFGCVVTHWAFMPDVPSQVYPWTLRWFDEVKKSKESKNENS